MKTYKCTNCGKEFLRYKSTVRNEKRVYCSMSCKNIHQKTINVGTGNPNYRHGKCTKVAKSFCSCGNEKDYRVEKCHKCSGRSFAIGSKRKNGSGTKIIEDNELIILVKTHISLTDLNKTTGISRQWLRDRIKHLKISIKHFKKCNNRPYTKEEVFVKNVKIGNNTVKKLLKEERKYQCEKCGLEDTWLGKPITIELHHINGDNMDNRIKNLQFLCPNCHSQTENNKGRKRREI